MSSLFASSTIVIFNERPQTSGLRRCLRPSNKTYVLIKQKELNVNKSFQVSSIFLSNLFFFVFFCAFNFFIFLNSLYFLL